MGVVEAAWLCAALACLVGCRPLRAARFGLGPTLLLRSMTTALNLFEMLLILQTLNTQGHIDYDLFLDRTIHIIER